MLGSLVEFWEVNRIGMNVGVLPNVRQFWGQQYSIGLYKHYPLGERFWCSSRSTRGRLGKNYTTCTRVEIAHGGELA